MALSCNIENYIQEPLEVFRCTIIKPLLLSVVNQMSTAVQAVIAIILCLSAFLLPLHGLDMLHAQS